MNTFLSRLPGRVAGAAVGALVAGLVLSDSEAHALIVNVGGQDYEVTKFTGSYIDNSSKFETAANGGVMPWWNSQTDAEAFASAVGTNLGLPNAGTSYFPSGFGPYFAWEKSWNYGPGGYYASDAAMVDNVGNVYSMHSSGPYIGPADVVTWAQATLVPAAGSANVPGPLPAVGLAVAFGFSRQLRKRIKASASNPPSASTEA